MNYVKESSPAYRLGQLMAGLVVLVLTCLILVMPAKATISLSISGDGVSNPLSFSEADLSAMDQAQYQFSTINTWPTKKMHVDQGVRLDELLQAAGIKDEAKIIKVTSSDGFSISFTVQELLRDTRYFYPGLLENHEYFGYIAGSAEDPRPVPTIIALQSAESSDFAHMNDKDAPLLVMGQRWVSEQTNQVFVKNVNSIEVSTAQPVRWEKPCFNLPGGEVAVGTLLELSTPDMDGDNIYYTLDGSDPGYDSPIYNWIKKRWWNSRPDDLTAINHPIEIKDNMTVKAVAMGFGKVASEIVTVEYSVPQPPLLTKDSSTNRVGQDIEISFVDDPDWRAVIQDVQVQGQSIAGQYTVEAGIIRIEAQVFSQIGNYQIAVLASGYAEARLEQNIQGFEPPGLIANSSENEVGQQIEISFVDDPDWRTAINDIQVDGQSIAGQYTVEAGAIRIEAQVFGQAGDYRIAVLASGYAEAVVQQSIIAQVLLQTPARDQEFTQGQHLSINGTAEGLSDLNLKIIDPDGVTVYGPSLITVTEGSFSSSYTLSSSAGIGVYTIVLDSDCLLAPIKLNFKVKASGGGNTNPPEEEDIILTISGDGVSSKKTFTLTQLEKLDQYQEVYSVINTWPTKRWYVGKGVKLSTLLDLAGKKSSAKLIKITSNDGYTATLTLNELLQDKRYCFPRFKEGGADGDGHVPGSSAGKRPVEPMIALLSAEGSDNPSYMDDLNSPLFMMGQRAVTEQVGNLFVKNVYQIEVLSSSPSTWDSPEADPGSGEVEAGTLVELSNNNMDDDKIHYTTDGSTPTLDSPIYNWVASRWWNQRKNELEYINHPIEITKDTTIKAITIGPGKKDSKVATFTYKVKPTPSNTTGKVEPSKDNTISLGNEAKLEIPANALAAQVEVSIKKVGSPPAVPGSFRLLSSVFELQVDGKSSYSFEDRVSLTLKFDPAQLKEGHTPSIFYYDEGSDQWINLGGTVKGSTITVQIDHFSIFAVMARETLGTELSDIIGHWAEENIKHLLGTKAIGGYPDGSFKPDQAINRAEFITILVKAFDLDRKEGQSFADTENHWAKEHIATAVGNGVASGYNENSFGPDDLITREQMAVMIFNASQVPELTAKMPFSDQEQISTWAREALENLVGHEIINGYPDHSIRPQGIASRAEAVTVIVNTLKLAEELLY